MNFIAAEFLVDIRGCWFPMRPQNVPRVEPEGVGAETKQNIS